MVDFHPGGLRRFRASLRLQCRSRGFLPFPFKLSPARLRALRQTAAQHPWTYLLFRVVYLLYPRPRPLSTRKKTPRIGCEESGACGRTRTGDLLITSELLYQLSHTSTSLTDAEYYTIFFTCRQLSFFRLGRNTVRILSRVFPPISPQAPGRVPPPRLHSSKSQERKPPFPAIFRLRVRVLSSPTD